VNFSLTIMSYLGRFSLEDASWALTDIVTITFKRTFSGILKQNWGLEEIMDTALQNKIVSFIWSIADDCLRDVYVRGKYRDVILPMFVLRRLDCLLEETKDAVTEEVRFQREEAGLTDLDPAALRDASGYVFYPSGSN
jgi:HsdM N-terminal domain